MQKNNHLFNFISNNIDKNYYDVILYQVNNILFNYGDHQKSAKNSFRRKIILLVKNIILYISRFYYLISKNEEKIIISNAYVSLNLDIYKTVAPPWSFSLKNKILSTYKLAKIVYEIKTILSKKNLSLLFSTSFENKIKLYENEFSSLLNNGTVKCIIVPNDLDFFENLSIKIAKKNNVPTFVYLHGLPARYNLIDDNRADYLIVWGKGIKQAYIDHGVLPNKILTIKHPVYSDFNYTKLTSSIDDVLVLTKAIAGTPSSSDKLFFGDRSKSLLYLEKLKIILKELGVKHARLRLHPSESKDFYKKNLIDNFYVFDQNDKIGSLKYSTLVVGPTSTMVLDTIKAGVNYILFDPKVDNKLLDNSDELVFPFDGSSFINLSLTTEDFKKNILNPKDNINQEKLSDFLEIDEADYQKFLNIISV